MTTDRAGLLRRLDQLGIAHTACDDRPVCAVEAAGLRAGRPPGGHATTPEWSPAERRRGAAGWPPPPSLRLALAVKPHQQT
jgi:hypothetical protein